MDDELTTAVVADAQMDQAETAGETAVAVAEVQADAAVEIAQEHTAQVEAQAEAAVAIAEAQAPEIDGQWLASEFGNLNRNIAEMASAMTSLTSLLQSTLTPPVVTVVETTEEPPPAETETNPDAEADGPRESHAASETEIPRRVRRLM